MLSGRIPEVTAEWPVTPEQTQAAPRYSVIDVGAVFEAIALLDLLAFFSARTGSWSTMTPNYLLR